MTRREESPQPNPPEARMLMGALDAQISVRDIAMWAQIPQSERQNFFSGDRAPCNVSLSPKDGVVYCRTEAKKAVRQWKMTPQDVHLGQLGLELMGTAISFAYAGENYVRELRSNGYVVNDAGLVVPPTIATDYINSLKRFADRFVGIDLPTMQEQFGGSLTLDVMEDCLGNLKLSPEVYDFVHGWISNQAHNRQGARLLLAQQVRKEYAEAGLGLDDLLMLWGIPNIKHNEFAKILESLAMEPKNRDALVANASALCPGVEHITGKDLKMARANALNLPTSIPSWEDARIRNESLLEQAAKALNFDKVTGSSAHERFVFTGKHGTRRRGINVGYENINGNYTSVSLVFGFRPEQQTRQTIFHEMVHVLHGSLISQHCGHDVWEAVTSGVRELFAMMVDRSSTQGMQNIPDTNTSVERIWYSPIYAYYQWRMHEEMAKEGYELSEEQLCVSNQRIQNEMHTMFQMSAKGVIYDISETARRVEINPLNPSDGIVYCIGEINSHNQHIKEGPTSMTNQKEQSIHPSALFETKWGKGWVYNPEAIDMLYAAMITSAHCADTEAVKKVIKELFADLENNPGLPKEVLSKYGIPHSQLITQAQNTNSSR